MPSPRPLLRRILRHGTEKKNRNKQETSETKARAFRRHSRPTGLKELLWTCHCSLRL